MQVDHRHASLRVHHNCKIDTACFEEGKRPLHRRDFRMDAALARGVDSARRYDRHPQPSVRRPSQPSRSVQRPNDAQRADDLVFFYGHEKIRGSPGRVAAPQILTEPTKQAGGHADRQSILSLALRTTLLHFSISSLIRAPNSSGVSTTALKPSTLRRSLTSGCLTALAVSL